MCSIRPARSEDDYNSFRDLATEYLWYAFVLWNFAMHVSSRDTTKISLAKTHAVVVSDPALASVYTLAAT
jgi:hypothetical protein